MAVIKNTFDYSPLIRHLRRVPGDLRVPVVAAIKAAANNMIAGPSRSLMANTPPANEHARGNKAKAQGEQAIKTDLLGGSRTRFATGKRLGIFTVMSDRILANAKVYNNGNIRLWRASDGTIFGTRAELLATSASISQMREHHKKYFRNGVMSNAGSNTQDIGRWRFISQMIVSKSAMDAYLKFIYARVGLFAASQMGAAMDLGNGSKVPAWVKRHPMKGNARWIINDRVMVCVMTFAPIFAEKEVRSRLDYIRRYAQNALRRRLPYVVKSVIEKRGSRSAGVLT